MQQASSFRHACVTGGAGFIGAHLVQGLLDAGIEVTVLDDLSTGTRHRIPADARFIQGSILDEDAVLEALEACDIVFHLAARVAIRSSFHFIVEDAETNLTGTSVVLRCAARSGKVKRFISTSSMAVYADAPSRIPIAETHPTQPISPYGVSKLACEQVTHLNCAHAGMESVVLRLFNTYGPGQSFSPYVGVVTIFINQLLSGHQPTIFGNGTQCRDFVHVNDVVQGFLKAMTSATPGQTYNIGSAAAQDLNSIYSQVAAALHSPVEPAFAEAVPGELLYSVADISRAKRDLGYQPRESLEPSLPQVVQEVQARATLEHA